MGERVAFAGSAISSSVARTSLVRSVDACARGIMMKSIDAMRNEMRICIAYWRKAIMSPMFDTSRSMRLALNHRIDIVMTFIRSVISGIMIAKSRLTFTDVAMRSRFASVKRSFS